MSLLDDEISYRHRDPFTAKSSKYFATPELNQRLHLIRHLVQDSEQLLLVLAETGYGKTSLLNQLKKVAAKHHDHWWLYTLNCGPSLSAEALVSTLLSAFNVRQDGKPTQILQDSLRNHIASTRYNGQLPVLLVDDAHLLPLATLRLIVDLALQGEPLTRMRVVLFCEPQITSILATPEFEIVHHTLIHTLDIPAFSKTETRDYIQSRLEGSQYGTVHPFNSDTLKKIHTESEGIPGEINLYAQEVLRKFAEHRADFWSPHALASSKLFWGIPIVILFIGLLLLVYWQSPQTVKSVKEDTLLPPEPSAALPPPHNSPTPPVAPDGQEKVAAPVKAPVTPTTASTFSLRQAPGQDTSTLASAVGTNLSSTPATATSHTDLVPANLLGRGDIKGEGWLLRQNTNAYTLQLMGSYDYVTLKKFLAQYSLTGNEIAMLKTVYNDKDWYVLVYGVYPSRTQAQLGIDSLPNSLRQNTQPWIRKLENIQNEIKGKLETSH
jgi:DamX protein